MNKTRAAHSLLAAGALCGWAWQASAQETTAAPSGGGRSLLGITGEYKGYPKRERVLIGNQKALSPAQFHEVYGARVDAGGGYEQSNYRLPEAKADVRRPFGSARALYGGDILTLGVEGTYSSSQANVKNSSAKEEYDVKKVTPIAAATVTDWMTIGAASDIGYLTVKERSAKNTTATYKFRTNRPIVGVALHNPRGEFGVAYASQVSASDRDPNALAGTPFTLARNQVADETRRDIYIPGHVLAYARGNVADNFSVMGTVAHTQYDANKAGAIELFRKYKREDRMFGSLQGTYWLTNWTRFTASALYRGATYAPFGNEETGFAYHLANTYGGGLDAEFRIADNSYAGLTSTYTRGERNETVAGTRWRAREDKATVGANYSVNF